MIYLIIGKSCSGKTTLINFLKEEYGFNIIKQYTTRKKRAVNEEDYFFVSNSEFFQKDIIYPKRYNGHLYGVSFESIRSNIDNSLLITDLLTARRIKKKCCAKIIYVRAPLVQRIKRMQLEKRSKIRVLIDIFYSFDILFADKILNNFCSKSNLFEEARGYFDEYCKDSKTFDVCKD